MGCDIHAFVEAKVLDGTSYVCISEIYLPRNYNLFAALANVRNDEDNPVKCIIAPRGLPHNSSGYVNLKYEQTGSRYAHSASYLTFYEIMEISHAMVSEKNFNPDYDMLGLEILGSAMSEFQEARLLFWFDN